MTYLLALEQGWPAMPRGLQRQNHHAGGPDIVHRSTASVTVRQDWHDTDLALGCCGVGYGEGMRFCGIDLAADPKNTGLAILSDDDTGLTVESVVVGVVDDLIVAIIQDVEYAGIDVPFGWPQDFVTFIQQQSTHALPVPATTGPKWRRELALRVTDREIHRTTGLTPLSVSANLIAYPAFRWSGIEARLRAADVDVSRDGSGAIAEVYPAAALYRWGLPHTGYKGSQRQAIRQQILEGLTDRFPRLDWNDHEALLVANDDALDAVIAGLVSHQIRSGHCEGPPERLRKAAKIEGWIWIPRRLDQ